MKKILVLLLVLMLPAPSFAQVNVGAQREAMKKWDKWVGTWQGTGWIEYATGKRMTYNITETIQSKLGGLALLVEGVGRGKRAGEEQEAIIHEALATITYDDRAKQYRFVTQTEKGMFAIPEAKLIENGWQWGLEFGQGMAIRYTVKMTDRGEWYEIGERTQDGKTWMQFHEMTLKRVK